MNEQLYSSWFSRDYVQQCTTYWLSAAGWLLSPLMRCPKQRSDEATSGMPYLTYHDSKLWNKQSWRQTLMPFNVYSLITTSLLFVVLCCLVSSCHFYFKKTTRASLHVHKHRIFNSQFYSQFNCMTLSWWPCHKIVSVTLHHITLHIIHKL